MFIQSISFSSILIVSMFSRHVLHLLMINIDQYWSYVVLFNSISSSIKSHLVFSCYEIFIVIEYYKNFYVKNTSGIQYCPSITRSPCITRFFLKIFSSRTCLIPKFYHKIGPFFVHPKAFRNRKSYIIFLRQEDVLICSRGHHTTVFFSGILPKVMISKFFIPNVFNPQISTGN